MNDDPTQIDVLYAKVKLVSEGVPEDALQSLVDGIVERFHAAGIMDKEWEHVKLHATLINSKRGSQG